MLSFDAQIASMSPEFFVERGSLREMPSQACRRGGMLVSLGKTAPAMRNG